MCERAVRAVAGLAYVEGCTVSRWYSTAPVPPGPQPRYINGVVRCAGAVEPERLLADLHALERAAGRVRGAPNAARTLDLDIIDMHAIVRAAPDPILPHPRAHERAFVLYPLRDVAPDWVHPRLRLSIAALIAALPPQDIFPL
jgi:2-amino-4-hydroxy-6-hydroxymethyldihydropteridine diphosphokinase